MSKSEQFIVQNNQFIPYDDAKTHIMSPAMKYGLTVFEGLRAYPSADGAKLYVFRLQEHIERLFQSMKLLRFDATFNIDEIIDNLLLLLRRNGIKSNAHIRVIAYLDGHGEMQVSGPVSYAIIVNEMPRSERVTEGARCQISSWSRISDNSIPPRIKCAANYVNSRLARFQAIHDGYDEAILLNSTGKVSEAPAACLFHVKDGVLITPDVVSGILESITRDTILTLAKDSNIQCVERSVDKTELYAADEVFLVGSAAEVMPVINIDGVTVGTGHSGTITRQLQNDYFSTVTGTSKDTRGWLTVI